MSVSKWRYTEECNGRPCPGDCDHCSFEPGDLISRADAIEAVHEYFKGRMRKSKCDYDDELQVYVVGKEERTMLTYNKGINDKLRSLPSAEAVKVAYICDGRKCDKDCSECFRTLDIEHARDFKRMGDAYYQQESANAELGMV